MSTDLLLPPDFERGFVDTSSPEEIDKLSAEDQQRIDQNGRLAVEGLTWSKARSPVWLLIGAVESHTRVTCPMTGFWNVLQLPSDLATDPLKGKYVTDWALAASDEVAEQGFKKWM